MRLRILLEPHHGASYDQILALARATEESGFDAFFRSDHYQGIDPDDTGYRPTDSWTTLAGLAVQTERVRLGTLMTASTYRRPGPLAITVATVDAMSGGRAELGIGAAWIEQEHRYLGIPFPPLGERFDRLGEQLEIITGLWATPPGERFSFRGKHYQLEECASVPRPARRPPVIIGGAGPRRTPALAARFADEFNSGMSDGLAARYANFRRICEQSGRDPAEVRLSTTLPVCCGPTRGEAARRAAALGEAGARMLAMGVTGTPGRHPRPPRRTARGRRRHGLLPPVRRHRPRSRPAARRRRPAPADVSITRPTAAPGQGRLSGEPHAYPMPRAGSLAVSAAQLGGFVERSITPGLFSTMRTYLATQRGGLCIIPASPWLRVGMKDVRDGGNVDESRFPSYTQRPRLGRWLRALAGTCLAVAMAGGSTMVAGGITSRASALVLAPNEPCSVLSAKAAGSKFCLKADAGNERVQLTWSPSAPVGSVIVYDAPPQDVGHPAAITNVTDTGALVTRLKNDTGYTFWLVDRKDGKTVVSDPVPATPAEASATVPGTPAGLTAAPGDTQVTLSWDPPASDGRPSASGYNVYQGTSAGGETGNPVNHSPVTSTSYQVTGLTNGSTYYFTVKAVSSSVIGITRVVNGENEGQASCEVSATPVGAPEAPTRLAPAPGDGQVTLSWAAPASDGGSAVTGYNVYYATSPNFTGATEVRAGTGTALLVDRLVNGTTYYFRVTAVNRLGEGPASAEVEAVPATVPGAPVRLTATPGDRQVTLTWTAPASDGGCADQRLQRLRGDVG